MACGPPSVHGFILSQLPAVFFIFFDNADVASLKEGIIGDPVMHKRMC